MSTPIQLGHSCRVGRYYLARMSERLFIDGASVDQQLTELQIFEYDNAPVRIGHWRSIMTGPYRSTRLALVLLAS
jgi:hypothetical protein